MKPSSPLAAFLERSNLRRMARARSFERGEEYFANRQVGAIAEHKGAITAKVRGTRPYQVKLWTENEELEYSCTCPVGADGDFCKHCVAMGVTWLEGRELMARLGRETEFTNYLIGVRAAHKPKRNFIKLLDQAKLFPA